MSVSTKRLKLSEYLNSKAKQTISCFILSKSIKKIRKYWKKISRKTLNPALIEGWEGVGGEGGEVGAVRFSLLNYF